MPHLKNAAASRFHKLTAKARQLLLMRIFLIALATNNTRILKALGFGSKARKSRKKRRKKGKRRKGKSRKHRSAKQRAATRKLVAFNKRRRR